MALDEIAANMKLQKRLCHNAPFYVLGPLVTDIGVGYDHITAAIGGAISASSGADFLCYVTPAEHLCLPNAQDVLDGLMATKIAAHAADIAKKVPHARDMDDKMGQARRKLDWDAMWKCALDPVTGKKRYEELPRRHRGHLHHVWQDVRRPHRQQDLRGHHDRPRHGGLALSPRPLLAASWCLSIVDV